MTGHVFVIHGTVDHLDYDAVVVPTDEAFSVRPCWDPVVGASSSDRSDGPSPHVRPAGWRYRGYGRSAHQTSDDQDLPVWYVATAHERGDQSGSLRTVME